MSNSGGVYCWSKIAAQNASADNTQNWAESMAPSAINDSARAGMASVAKWRDDISGAIVTTGTSTSYVVASNQDFDSLSDMNGQVIAFSPHATNTGTQTFLNVDGLGSKTVRSAPGVDLQPGTLIQGTPYVATYNNSDGVFYLQGFYGNPYNVPLGSSLNYWGGTAPNSSFAFPFGQAISRTTYATLFALISTIYGVGDGSSTFNLPDLRGRVIASLDNMGGSAAGRLSGYTGLNVSGGEQTHTLAVSELPAGITSSGGNTIVVNPASSASFPVIPAGASIASFNGGPLSGSADFFPGSPSSGWSAANSMSGSNTINVTSNNTSGSSHNNIQPTIVCNQAMRIL